MKRVFSLSSILILLAWASSGSQAQQTQAAGGVPVQLLVTVEPKHGTNVPEIKRDDVMVFEGRDRLQVTDWVAARGERAGLELFILIDDSANTSLGSQLEDIRRFIDAQPPSTKIGIAYMQNGTAQVLQAPTADHAAAGKALRLPMGVAGANASPYFSLSDLIKKWAAGADRRAVLLVTDGIDRYYGEGDLSNPYVQAAIDDAGRAGIVVSSIYTPGEGHFGHSYYQNYWGQIYLSQVADKTGGEAYYLGFTGAPVSFAPYLEQLSRRLSNQYFLSFLARPEKKAGWRQVRLMTEIHEVDLVSAGRVYVSAGP
jgi:VWFA-related protein